MNALIFAAAVCATTSFAPTFQPSVLDKPDFSGSWVLESSESAEEVPRAMAVTQALNRTNVRGEPVTPFFGEIAITRTLQDGPRSQTYTIGSVGGTVFGSDVTPSKMANLHHSVVWEGGSLVMTSGGYTGPRPGTGAWSQRRETWTLDSTGRLHVEIATRSSTEAEKTASLVYRRE